MLWNLPKVFGIDKYHTDDRGSYLKFIPAERYQIGKDNSWKIERKNPNFRTHLKRLNALKATAGRVGEMSPEKQEALLPLIGQGYEYLQKGELGIFNNFMFGGDDSLFPVFLYDFALGLAFLILSSLND